VDAAEGFGSGVVFEEELDEAILFLPAAEPVGVDVLSEGVGALLFGPPELEFAAGFAAGYGGEAAENVVDADAVRELLRGGEADDPVVPVSEFAERCVAIDGQQLGAES
jgi:hypothetical protein